MSADPDFADDLGPGAKARRSAIVTVGGEYRGAIKDGSVQARRYACECTVDELHAAQKLTDAQWAAAMKFRGLWLIGARHTSVTAMYGERIRGQDAQAAATTTVSAREKLLEAIRATGLIGSNALISTCGEDEMPRQMAPLLRALSDLCVLWKIDPAHKRAETDY